VKAYRLPPDKRKHQREFTDHLYRHRISDSTFKSQSDPPSIMMYLSLRKTKKSKNNPADIMMDSHLPDVDIMDLKLE